MEEAKEVGEAVSAVMAVAADSAEVFVHPLSVGICSGKGTAVAPDIVTGP